jgi:AAA family ATP:ADP antiporter
MIKDQKIISLSPLSSLPPFCRLHMDSLSMLEKIAKLFDIRSNERHLVLLLMLHSLNYGLLTVFFESAANALFLAQFSIDMMPIAYISCSVIIPLFGLLFTKLDQFLTPMRLFLTLVSSLLCCLLIFWLLLTFSHARWPIFLLFIWIEVHSVVLTMVFGGLCSYLFNVRQGKRLFSLIGSAQVLGGMIGGLLIPHIVTWCGALNLLWFSMFFMSMIIVVLITIGRTDQAHLRAHESESEVEHPKQISFRQLFNNRYLMLVMSVSLLYIMVDCFTEFVFYGNTQARYSDEVAIASFFGPFFAIVNGASLCFRIFISAPLFARFGLSLALILMPTLAFAALGAASVASLFTGGALVVFWSIILARLMQLILTSALHEPTALILYQPLPKSQRFSLQAKIEGMIEPAASGLAGFILLLFSKSPSFSPIYMIYVSLILLAVWISLTFVLRREYTLMLLNGLLGRQISPMPIHSHGREIVRLLEKHLASPYAGEALYALELLKSANSKQCPDYCERLLARQEPFIRMYVLKSIDQASYKIPKEALLRHFDSESDIEIKAQYLRILPIADDEELEARFLDYLQSGHLLLVKGALIGLIRHAGIHGILLAGSRLMAMCQSDECSHRRAAADVLGEIGIKSFYPSLIPLIADTDEHVRKAAISAAGKLKSPPLWPILLQALERQNHQLEICNALTACGPAILPLFEEALETSQPHIAQWILKICGRIRGPRAIHLLLQVIDHRDPYLRSKALMALSSCSFVASEHNRSMIYERFQAEIFVAAHLLAALVDLQDSSDADILLRALEADLWQCTQRLVLLLSFVHSGSLFRAAMDNLKCLHLHKHAAVMEIFDDILSTDEKHAFLPLIDDLPFDDKLKALPHPADVVGLSSLARLLEVAENERFYYSPWTRACALYVLSFNASFSYLQGIMPKYTHDSDPIIRETALWVESRI